ncbi:histidine phosphatase family protein [Vagococcus hydrophili]|uniref:Histidine phosphatase family protein n=1 Tax=Vagococcus hydrophili TaxID=2714947 RepID=A0A6G8AWT9_9ENTE|nr:histidine phosphatase family protein [Vagococcus hydrophili]QIL49415.1 histidine phosphatase family protein [Vagococcus hydrophili]
MKTTIYFIRHGETVWNQMKKMQGLKNSELTDKGVEQATLLGEKLVTEKVDIICTSPSIRAVKTSELINRSLNVPVMKDDGFQEIDMGDWEGKTYDEISRKYPEEWELFWHEPLKFKGENHGETFKELGERSTNSINEILEVLEGKTVAIVSHRITIKTMVSEILGKPLNELEDVLPNSLTKIVFDEGKQDVEFYSDISHYNNKDEKGV